MTSQESEALEKAREEMVAHALRVISKDNQPDRNTPNFDRLLLCECPDCKPELYPSNIQDLIDQDMQDVAWFHDPSLLK